MLPNVVSSLLKGGSFCRLCFAVVSKDALSLLDEVLVNPKTNGTEEIAKILRYVLGNKYPADMDSDDVVCNNCIKSIRGSYIFIKMCENNSAQLANLVNTLSDSFENTAEHLDDCKSIFIQLEMEDFSVTQYYDTKQFDKNITMALARFRFLLKGTYRKPVKKLPRTTRTPRIHNYSEDMSKICDIIRENGRPKFKCKDCNGIFNRSYNFKKHYYSQHSCKQIECTECGKCYGSEALLKQHKYSSHASVTCSICGKSYKNRFSLLYHMRQHTGEQPYQCQYCDMKFKWSSRRAEHVRRYHLEPSAECDICHTKFRSLGSLYDHRKRHFNPNSRLHVTQQTPPVAEEEEVNTELETLN